MLALALYYPVEREVVPRLAPGARVARTFTTTFAGTLVRGEVAGQQLDVFLIHRVASWSPRQRRGVGGAGRTRRAPGPPESFSPLQA